MTRLHQAASAVKSKVQGSISHCFTHKNPDGDEDLDPQQTSDDSEGSVSRSVSSITEYFDAEADEDIDYSAFDQPQTQKEEYAWQHHSHGNQNFGDVQGNGHHEHGHVHQNGYHHRQPEVDFSVREAPALAKQPQKVAALGNPVPVDVEKVSELRKILAEDATLDQKKMQDKVLMRFLFARNMDAQKAAEMFTVHCRWRDEYVPRGYILESEIAHQLDAEKTFGQGFDRHGRPLMVVHGCKHIAKDRDMEEFKRYAVYCMDKVIASMPEGVEKFCCIFDLGNTGLKNFDTSAMLVLLDFFQAHYPERLGKLFMIHVPFIFWGVWKVASKAMLPRTRAKINFLTDEEVTRTLRHEIGEECLPKMYGGKAELQPMQRVHLGDPPPQVFC